MSDSTLISAVETILRDNLISSDPENDTIKGIYTFLPPTDAQSPYVIVSLDDTSDDKVSIDGLSDEEIDVLVIVSVYNETGKSSTTESSKNLILTATEAVRDVVEAGNFAEMLDTNTGGEQLRLTNISRTYTKSTGSSAEQLECYITLSVKITKDKRDNLS